MLLRLRGYRAYAEQDGGSVRGRVSAAEGTRAAGAVSRYAAVNNAYAAYFAAAYHRRAMPCDTADWRDAGTRN